MTNTRKLPIGIQDFGKLRSDGYVYVDKTALIYPLVQTTSPYFLSRPRRFGKSLLVTTLEAYFRGNRKPFEGLAIAGLETEWAEHPVLKFSLAGGEFGQAGGLRAVLNKTLEDFEREYELPQGDAANLPGRFKDALKNAVTRKGRRVAVLVDEYDNPLLKVMGTEAEEANRELYKGFFATLKDCDAYLRFVLFTGVTKFSKVSIFSDLNQLQDISMDGDYAALCGVTQEELERDFAPEVDALAAANGMTRGGCLVKLKERYDGYHFTRNCPDIYNPFSLINAFKKREFGRYWFSTGTPTFLVRRLNDGGFDPRRLSDGSLYASEADITDYRPDNPDVVPLLYQSGYLTITGYDKDFDSYTLGYPNDEVKYGFTESLAPVYLHGDGPLDVRSFGRDIRAGNTDGLRDRLTALFARLPYATGAAATDDRPVERDFQNVIYLVFLLLGQFVHVEQHSARGRADCVVETDGYVYVFEFKRDASADDALTQIAAQGYAAPYAADSRTLITVGANFDSAKRNITEWKAVHR